MKDNLSHQVWGVYVDLFCKHKDPNYIYKFTGLLDVLTEEKTPNLIAELKPAEQILFLNTILLLQNNKKILRTPLVFQQDVSEKIKSILLICAWGHDNRLLSALLKVGAGKFYEGIEALDMEYHPLYVCSLNNNLEGFKIFLQYAPTLGLIKIQTTYNWYFAASLFCLERKFNFIKELHNIRPDFLDLENASKCNLGHFVFAGIGGESLKESFTLVFSLRKELFIKKNGFGKTPWDAQRLDHPNQTPEKLLGPDCYSNPELKPYLPEKLTMSEDKESISALTKGSMSIASHSGPAPSTPPLLCEGQCLVM